MARPKVDIREKVQKEFPEFTDTVNSLSVSELNERIATYAKESEAVEKAKEEDEALEDAKGVVQELSAPYKDAKKAIRMKIRYMIALIQDQGGK